MGWGCSLLIFGGHAIANGFVTYHMKRMSSGPTFAYVYLGGLSIGHSSQECCSSRSVSLRRHCGPTGSPASSVSFTTLGCCPSRDHWVVFATAYLAFAIAILVDKNEIFPKWLAYLTIWQIVTEVIATQMWLQTSGPFAWNGSIAFWLAVLLFGLWLNSQLLMVKKATELHPAGSRPPD